MVVHKLSIEFPVQTELNTDTHALLYEETTKNKINEKCWSQEEVVQISLYRILKSL